MKRNLLYAAALTALVATGCRKIETDGEKEIIVINGGGTTTTGQTIYLQGRINADTLLKKENTYILKGIVYMVGNHTMRIEPGTTIKGSFAGSDVAALVITRGSKLVANGTPTDPIVFTSLAPSPQSGDWGGIVICGKAPVNSSFNGTPNTLQVEGGVDNSNGDGIAGGTDVADSSGALSYVRIEYAGYAFQPDKEINSLTMAAVGNKTVIDHVQVSYGKDDAFEWFGGTVNCRYLIAYKTQDDDFDTDNGYNGNIQFGLVIRDSSIADVSRSEAFESDNNASGTTATPKTAPVFSNITVIGPRANTTNIGNTLYRAAAHIRRNSEMCLFNSIIVGWPLAIEIDGTTGTPTSGNVGNGLVLSNNFLGGNTDSIKYSGPSGSAYTTADLVSYFKTPALANTIVNGTLPAAVLIQPFNYTTPDPTPFGNATTIVGTTAAPRAAFTHAKVSSNFFTQTQFIGAIAPAGELATWWKGWTKFN